MKHIRRKITSLLLLIAITCTMMPTALAASLSVGDEMTLTASFSEYLMYGDLPYAMLTDVQWDSSSRAASVSSRGSSFEKATVYGNTYGTAVITATPVYTLIGQETIAPDEYAQSWTISVGGATSSGTTYPDTGISSTGVNLSQGNMALSVGGTNSLIVSPSSSRYDIYSVSWNSSNPRVAYVSNEDYLWGTTASVTGLSAGTATVTADVTYYDTRLNNYFTATLGCTVTVGSGYGYGTDYNSGDFYISATSQYLDPNGGYAVLSAIPYINGNNLNLDNLVWYSSDPSVVSVNYYNNTVPNNYATGPSVYVYGLSAGTATIYAYLSTNSDIYAAYQVTVGGGTTDVDVIYSLTKGESLVLDVESFEDFWSEVATSYGALDYVRFGTSSGSVGKLTYDRYNSTTSTAVGSNYFYVDPGYNEYGIDDVTFTPSKTTTGYRTGTLVIPFTAYGTDSYHSTRNTSYSGTMYIVVTNGEVQDISYASTSSNVTLDPDDFVSVYRQATESTTSNPTVYVEFLDTPTFGDLYYNYGTNPYGTAPGTKLTDNNIGAWRFTSRSIGTSIEDVTYVPGTASGDTIRYAAYSSATGGTLLYIGEINFGAATPLAVKYYGAINTAIDFSGYTFLNSNEDLYTTEYITFGNPSSGTLYKDYANGTGTRVTSGTTFTLSDTGTYNVPSVNGLTFVPAVNYTGVVEIPFTASNILNKETSGTVKIYVAKKFSDVATTNWAYNYITELAAQGIVDGMTSTTFAPQQDLKYGEALKLIMEAVGYSELSKTGSHWASGYLTRAFRDGLVTSATIDLESTINRNEIASIAAKALRLSQATSVNAGIVKPVDSNNGYVLAMYNAGILTGEFVGGKNYYNGSDTLTRAEVCAIVCRISEYNK